MTQKASDTAVGAKHETAARGPLQYRVVTILAILLVVVLSTQYSVTTAAPKPIQIEQARNQGVHHIEPSTDYPTVNQDIINGTNVIFVEPRNVSGILFVAHGCSHSHTDWFLGCDRCIGLPEERAIVLTALDLGLVVVAMSSSNRDTKCWSLHYDIESVGFVLQEMATRYGTSIQLLLFGSSSGGSFVSAAATPLAEQFGLPVAGFISQIAAMEVRNDTSRCRVYITMNKNERTVANAAHLTSIVRPPSKSLHIRLPPLPIRDDYFSTRIPEIDTEQSAKMTMSLRTHGLLDDNDFLRDSPRRSNWRAAVEPFLPLARLEWDTLLPDHSPISEVMNVAYGVHETTRDGVKEAFEFCLLTPSPT
jgi:hypothetical protein